MDFSQGRIGYKPIALVIHTESGSESATASWFNNPSSIVSAHYGVSLMADDTVDQFVALTDEAYANGVLEAGNRWPGTRNVNPNLESVAIETEDAGNPAQPVTDIQYDKVYRLAAGIILPACPTITYLVAHSAISPRSRPNCPGDRWILSGRLNQLATALGLTLVV